MPQPVTSKIQRSVLYEELRFIERGEAEINPVWRGAHILFFFLAFIFGTFCTFCFQMLMYVFDDKCVLFPKLLAVTSPRHNNIYEFMPIKDRNNSMQLEYVNAQWMDPAVCYLPVYAPIVSAIFGLVWITIFIMCSAGTRTHTGLRSPWRVLIPVFVFSVVMSILCIHASSVTQAGLHAFCDTLSQITDGQPCSYAVNVVSLAYHRRIRGVYQATRLTTISAWFHTICWICSVALVVIRVCLAVDFQLVRVRVELIGDVDLMLQRHERLIRTISPDSELLKTRAKAEDSSGKESDDLQAPSRKKRGQIVEKSDATTALKDEQALSGLDPLSSPNRTELTDKDQTSNEAILEYIRRLYIQHAPLLDYLDVPLSLEDNKEKRITSEQKCQTCCSEPQQPTLEDYTTEAKENSAEVNPLGPKPQKNNTSLTTCKKVNISKYVLAHHPSENFTQQRELVDREESHPSKTRRYSKESSLNLRPSQSEADISLVLNKDKEYNKRLSSQSLIDDKEVWFKEPPSMPQSHTDKLATRSDLTMPSPLQEIKKGKMASRKILPTEPKKDNQSIVRPSKPQTNKRDEDPLATTSKQQHPDSQTKEDEPSTPHDANDSDDSEDPSDTEKKTEPTVRRWAY